MKKFSHHIFPLLLIFLTTFGLFAICKDAYLNLHNYRFIVDLNKNFVENKKLELIDIIHEVEDFEDDDFDLIEQKQKRFLLFKLKSSSEEYKQFVQKIKNLPDNELNSLFLNLFSSLNLPIDISDTVTMRSKGKFIIDLFSSNNENEYVNYSFDFVDKVNDILRNQKNISDEWTAKLKKYDYRTSKSLREIFEEILSDIDGKNETEKERKLLVVKKNKDYDYWIDRKFNINFFTNLDSTDNSYSVLPGLISELLIMIFIIVTVLSFSVFMGLYLDVFIENNNKFKRIFVKIVNFYESLPEILLAIFTFVIVNNFFHINNRSILLFASFLFLIISPSIIKIVFRSLNMITDNLKNDLKMTEAKVKFLINNVLPVIMPYIAYRLVKIFAYITNLGLLFFILLSDDYSYQVPHAFSNIASSLGSDFFISLTKQSQHFHLIGPILFVIVLINLSFYLIALLLKRFIPSKLIK